MVEKLKATDCDRHGQSQNLLGPFCCVLEKDTLRPFVLLGNLGKQF